VFSAGDDATGSYTVYVSNVVTVADIHVDLGNLTIAPHPVYGGSLKLTAWENFELTNNVNRLLSAGHKADSARVTYLVSLNGAQNIIRYKRGAVVLAATNNYTGTTTIEGGILQLGASHVLPSASTLVLANNDTSRGDFSPAWQYTPAVFALAGFSQNLAGLQLTGTDYSVSRVLDFGDGNSALVFGDSSALDWAGYNVNIVNYTRGQDSLRFGSNANGLTATQLDLIRFTDFQNLPGQINSQGYVTPAIPSLFQPVRNNSTIVTLTWTSVVGRAYRVQFKTNLTDTSWNDLTPDIYAQDVTATTMDTSATNQNRFYRVMVLP
jgi:autotransporter-associated beta strand protein